MTQVAQQVQPAPTNAIAPQQAQTGIVKKFTEDTVGSVLRRISDFQTQGGLKLPPDYSAENAVRSAWLILQDVKDLEKKPALTVCSTDSIANALLNMVLQGLNPVKKQCYFIVYGNKLELQKSYLGTIAVAKRTGDVKDIVANTVYSDDTFEYEIDAITGVKKIIKHSQKLENIDISKIKGFYAIITRNDGSTYTEIMTLAQAKSAWEMGKAKGVSPAHKQFPDQMGCKSVINRGLKVIIGSSDDADLYEEDDMPETPFTAGVKHQIAENANKQEIGFEPEPPIQEPEQIADQPEINIEQPEDTSGSGAQNGQQLKAPF
jgi:recombination protein RecT